MALPITIQSPLVRTNNFDGPGSYYRKQVRSKQVKPYNLPAPYSLAHVVVERAELYGAQSSWIGMCNAAREKSPEWGCSPVETPRRCKTMRDQADNTARAKLLAQLGGEALLATNYIERKQSYDMIKNRALQLYRFSRSLRRGDLVGAGRELGMGRPRGTRPNNVRRTARKFSDLWLEYHFGWEPLVQDIGACVELLQNPVPYGRYSAVGREVPVDLTFKTATQKTVYQGMARTRVGANLSISNPNLYLANKLGFVNPAGILWEAIPFSFVVDWFVNVGAFLNQATDLWGIKVVNPYTTRILVIKSCEADYRYIYANRIYGVKSVSRGVWLDRLTTLPGVTLGVRPPWRLSPVRAATAISLLVQKGLKG